MLTSVLFISSPLCVSYLSSPNLSPPTHTQPPTTTTTTLPFPLFRTAYQRIPRKPLDDVMRWGCRSNTDISRERERERESSSFFPEYDPKVLAPRAEPTAPAPPPLLHPEHLASHNNQNLEIRQVLAHIHTGWGRFCPFAATITEARREVLCLHGSTWATSFRSKVPWTRWIYFGVTPSGPSVPGQPRQFISLSATWSQEMGIQLSSVLLGTSTGNYSDRRKSGDSFCRWTTSCTLHRLNRD